MSRRVRPASHNWRRHDDDDDDVVVMLVVAVAHLPAILDRPLPLASQSIVQFRLSPQLTGLIALALITRQLRHQRL